MKTQNPWMGRFRGSAGNMTGCKVYDKNVLRAKAFEVANPNTPAQQVQRNFFKSLSQLVATFSDDQLRTLYGQKPKGMSRRNAMAKLLAEDWTTDDGAKVIDYPNINTLGNAATMDFGTTGCTWSGNNMAVSLDASVTAITTLADNYFIAAIVNDTKGEIYMGVTSEKVSVGALSIAKPSNWETTDTIHAIPLILDGKIPLVGFGTMAVNKRPTKA